VKMITPFSRFGAGVPATGEGFESEAISASSMCNGEGNRREPRDKIHPGSAE
jgi:hypothetical protein